MGQTEVRQLIRGRHETQQEVTNEIVDHADFDKLGCSRPGGFTAKDVLRMWVWHFWSHQRDLALARGRLVD